MPKLKSNDAAPHAAAAAFVGGTDASGGVMPPLPEEQPAQLLGAEEVVQGGSAPTDAAKDVKKEATGKRKKLRQCKFPGCTNTVKSQGHCQRHGAKSKRCKAPGCDCQAQGGHEGYCKKHWREFAAPEDQRRPPKVKAPEEPTTCEPVGTSVYDHVLPASFSWRPEGRPFKMNKVPKTGEGGGTSVLGNVGSVEDVKKDVMNVLANTELIPILQYMLDNEHLEAGWHRIAERLSRGIRPPKKVTTQLEPWEKQLAVMEMALIAGTDTKHLSAHKASKVLAHAWGREKGFQRLLFESHCARRGELDRKKRVDAGSTLSSEKKALYNTKRAVTREKKRKGKSLEATLGDLSVPGGEAAMDTGEHLVASAAVKYTEVAPLEPPPVQV